MARFPRATESADAVQVFRPGSSVRDFAVAPGPSMTPPQSLTRVHRSRETLAKLARESSVLVLHFVHGKYEGQIFPLEGPGFIAGRSTDADLVLADDAVSRKHVRFFPKRNHVWLQDLGSSNGTFVNGHKVERHCLREGDYVAIGSSLGQVEHLARSRIPRSRAGEKKTRVGLEGTATGRSMAGNLEEIPLFDVLQWLATSRKTGALVVRDSVSRRGGKLHLRDGQVFFASIEGKTSLLPEKAMMRMVNWTQGTFEFKHSELDDAPTKMSISLEHLLMESARQQDELNHLADTHRLPVSGAAILLVRPSPVRWTELPEDELELVQDIAQFERWEDVLDHNQRDDVSLHKILVSLLEKGVIRYE